MDQRVELVAAVLGAANPATVILGSLLVLGVLWVALIWPIKVANRIGRRKGRRGWIYPVVGFLLVLGALGSWVGVWILHMRAPRPGFSHHGRLPKLRMPPSAAAVVFQDEASQRPTSQPYVPPKRCPDCRGLVPTEAAACGRCGHSFLHAGTT
jgi:hypothetical protein